MGHGRHISGSSYPTPGPPAPVADYNVTGTPTPSPDCKCNYYNAGIYANKPYYKRSDNAFYLFWFDLVLVWIISNALGQVTNCFSSDGQNIEHTYIPVGTYQGNPIVSAGPH